VRLDRIIARRAARLRASHRALRLRDAHSLATALVAGAEHVTLDRCFGTIAEIERTAG